MKKFLLALTVGLVALVGTACSTPAPAAVSVTTDAKFNGPEGTVEDRRTPITVSPSITAPTTSTTTGGLIEATPAVIGGDEAFMAGLDGMIAADKLIWAAVDLNDVDATQAACLLQGKYVIDAYDALASYTGKFADQLTVGLGMYAAADSSCIEGDFVNAADKFIAADAYWSALADLWS